MHPGMPEMNPTSDDKVKSYICGSLWNIKKCSCGTSDNDEGNDLYYSVRIFIYFGTLEVADMENETYELQEV